MVIISPCHGEDAGSIPATRSRISIPTRKFSITDYMNIRIRKLSNQQVYAFKNISSAMGSLPTLLRQGTYPKALVDCGINERDEPNLLVGYIATRPSGSQLGIETVFHDPKDNCDNGDLHIINFKSKEVASHYCGWGTWTTYYGDNHWGKKDYLRAGTSTSS